jgi:glycosyltransferase involved in cell wall biosynthesis
MMGRYLCNVDALFSTNYQMLNYQLTTFNPKKHLITNVIYTPSQIKIKTFPKPDTKTNYFVYTGLFYRVRRSVYILEGFEKLLRIYPDSKLIFVGSQLSSLSLTGLKPETLMKIDIIPFTRDLDPYYHSATALLDIDADIENDVFLSSKVTTYIMINRIIICETGMNSPARHLFKGIDSIIKCGHDPEQLCEAMKKSILLKHAISFEDRNTIIKMFQIENIVGQIDCSLKQIMTLEDIS